MLGAMRGAVNVGEAFGRLRRQVYSGVVDTDSTPDVQISTLLDDFFSKHRSCKSHISFSTRDTSFSTYFYGKATDYYLENEGGVLTYIFSEQLESYVRQIGLAIRCSGRRRFCCYSSIFI